MFITLEGDEGVGKTTQAQLLVDRLKADGHTVRHVREPGGTPVSEAIRGILKGQWKSFSARAELLLMCAARAQLVEEVIMPALAAKEIVVSDRFIHSTIAYQGHGRGLLSEAYEAIDIAVQDLKPDMTLLILAPREVIEKRLKSRAIDLDRIEREDEAFFARVNEGYRQIETWDNVWTIWGDRDPLDVAGDIWNLVSSRRALYT